MAHLLVSLRKSSKYSNRSFQLLKNEDTSYSSVATLAIKYSDGEGYDGATVAEVEGRVPLSGGLAGHRSLQVQPEGVVVPGGVLKKFAAKEWLVEAEHEGN